MSFAPGSVPQCVRARVRVKTYAGVRTGVRTAIAYRACKCPKTLTFLNISQPSSRQQIRSPVRGFWRFFAVPAFGLDLKSARGLEVLHALLQSADVCVANMRPSALQRLGLTTEHLHALNPKLVYCGLVGFGQQGRYRHRPAYDSIIQGVAGVAGTFESATGEPRYVPMTIADHIVGIIASQMILLDRERTGKGQTIEVPMFENMAAFVLSEHMGQHTFLPPRGDMGDARLLDPAARPIPIHDGHISISANTNQQAFALFDAIGRPELKADPRFSTVKARYQNVGEYFRVRAEGLFQKKTAEWLALFDELDVPADPCHTLESLMQDPHLGDVDLLSRQRHHLEGEVVNIGLPNRSTARAREELLPAPACGEHTRDVLAEDGFTRFRRAGAAEPPLRMISVRIDPRPWTLFPSRSACC